MSIAAPRRTLQSVPKDEQEVRYLLPLDFDLGRLRGMESVKIHQGYLNRNQRVRYYMGSRFENGQLITPDDSDLIPLPQGDSRLKHGRGRLRKEHPKVLLPVDAAKQMVDMCCDSFTKIRVKHPASTKECEAVVNICCNNLHSIVFCELEWKGDAPAFIPDWVEEGIEITDHISNYDLACMDRYVGGMDREVLWRRLAAPPIPLISCDGGPCSGKNTFLDALHEQYGDVLQCAPECAEVLMGVGRNIPPLESLGGDQYDWIRFEQNILAMQEVFEEQAQITARLLGKKAVIVNRSLPHVGAYLEGGMEAVCALRDTSPEEELSRYTAMLDFEIPTKEVFEEKRALNPTRYESDYSEVVDRAEKTTALIQDHPGYYWVPFFPDWFDKQNYALNHLREVVHLS